MRSVWWRRALQQRLGTLAGAALMFWTAGTAIAASVATDRMTDSILAERSTRARGIASRVELALEDDWRQLDLVAGASMTAPGSTAMVAHVRGVRLAESVLRIAPDGQVVWARSVPDGRETTPILTRVPRPGNGHWHAETTNLIETSHGPRVFLMLPARESDELGGAIAATIAPETTGLRALVASYAAEPYRVALVDMAGREIASSRSAAPRDVEPVSAGQDDDSLVATALVWNGPWQVRLVQPRADAIAAVLALRRLLVVSSMLLLAFAVLVALATARSIREPVLAMTSAAERLARGELALPIPPAGEDEIGRLSLALEQLRKALEGDEGRSVLLKGVIAAQEEERRRIARELHDETTQQLTALAMQLESVSAVHPHTSATLSRSQALVGSMIDDLHRVIYDLRPSVLDDLGLLPAIRSYADTHLASRGIAVHWEFPDALPDLSQEASTTLFRVVQEALTNVARHSRADTVLVGCTLTDDQITLEVEDDGIGFEPEGTRRPRETGEGLGLLGMRERVALLGGRCDIDSEPGGGTRVVAVLPLGGRGTTA